MSPYGPREARLTLRRTHDSATVFALLVIEDVTERRKLERQMADGSGSAPVLAPREKQAFEELGRKLNEATAQAPLHLQRQCRNQGRGAVTRPARAAAATASSESLPRILTDALERQGKPFAIIKDHKPAYARQNLAHLLGPSCMADLMQYDRRLAST